MAIRVDHGVGPSVPAASYAAGLMRGQRRYGAQAAQLAQDALDRRDRRRREEFEAALAVHDRQQRGQQGAIRLAQSLADRERQSELDRIGIEQDERLMDFRESQQRDRYALDVAGLGQRYDALAQQERMRQSDNEFALQRDRERNRAYEQRSSQQFMLDQYEDVAPRFREAIGQLSRYGTEQGRQLLAEMQQFQDSYQKAMDSGRLTPYEMSSYATPRMDKYLQRFSTDLLVPDRERLGERWSDGVWEYQNSDTPGEPPRRIGLAQGATVKDAVAAEQYVDGDTRYMLKPGRGGMEVVTEQMEAQESQVAPPFDDKEYEKLREDAVSRILERRAREGSNFSPVVEPQDIASEIQRYREERDRVRELLSGEVSDPRRARVQPLKKTLPKSQDGADADPGRRRERPYTPSPGRLNEEQTRARDQLAAMPIRQRVEQLLPYHPETRGRSLDEILDSPEARQAYQQYVDEGILEPNSYERYSLEILDEQLSDAVGLYDQQGAVVGMNVNDVTDPILKERVDALPRPTSLQEAQSLESLYFVDPEGNIRRTR